MYNNLLCTFHEPCPSRPYILLELCTVASVTIILKQGEGLWNEEVNGSMGRKRDFPRVLYLLCDLRLDLSGFTENLGPTGGRSSWTLRQGLFCLVRRPLDLSVPSRLHSVKESIRGSVTVFIVKDRY